MDETVSSHGTFSSPVKMTPGAASAPQVPATRRLLDFKILNKLGSGSFSTVYKVLRIADNQVYALKKVRMNRLNDKDKSNALNEIRILASIRSDHVVEYRDSFFDAASESLCIIMEYAGEGDLLQKLKAIKLENQNLLDEAESQQSQRSTHQQGGNKKQAVQLKYLEESQIWDYFVQTLKGLECLHSMSIFHRDLKCANLFIDANNVLKIGDLNVSKVARKPDSLAKTQTGTPYYTAPEIWKGHAYSYKSDIWSLGCIIYELAAQVPPFAGHSIEGLYMNIMKGKYQRIPETYSDSLVSVISLCLLQNPNERPDCADLLRLPTFTTKIAQYETTYKNFLKYAQPTPAAVVPKSHQQQHHLSMHLNHPNASQQSPFLELTPQRRDSNSQNQQYQQHLIDTIHLPSSLKKLSALLPRPNYEENHCHAANAAGQLHPLHRLPSISEFDENYQLQQNKNKLPNSFNSNNSLKSHFHSPPPSGKNSSSKKQKKPSQHQSSQQYTALSDQTAESMMMLTQSPMSNRENHRSLSNNNEDRNCVSIDVAKPKQYHDLVQDSPIRMNLKRVEMGNQLDDRQHSQPKRHTQSCNSRPTNEPSAEIATDAEGIKQSQRINPENKTQNNHSNEGIKKYEIKVSGGLSIDNSNQQSSQNDNIDIEQIHCASSTSSLVEQPPTKQILIDQTSNQKQTQQQHHLLVPVACASTSTGSASKIPHNPTTPSVQSFNAYVSKLKAQTPNVRSRYSQQDDENIFRPMQQQQQQQQRNTLLAAGSNTLRLRSHQSYHNHSNYANIEAVAAATPSTRVRFSQQFDQQYSLSNQHYSSKDKYRSSGFSHYNNNYNDTSSSFDEQQQQYQQQMNQSRPKWLKMSTSKKSPNPKESSQQHSPPMLSTSPQQSIGTQQQQQQYHHQQFMQLQQQQLHQQQKQQQSNSIFSQQLGPSIQRITDILSSASRVVAQKNQSGSQSVSQPRISSFSPQKKSPVRSPLNKLMKRYLPRGAAAAAATTKNGVIPGSTGSPPHSSHITTAMATSTTTSINTMKSNRGNSNWANVKIQTQQSQPFQQVGQQSKARRSYSFAKQYAQQQQQLPLQSQQLQQYQQFPSIIAAIGDMQSEESSRISDQSLLLAISNHSFYKQMPSDQDIAAFCYTNNNNNNENNPNGGNKTYGFEMTAALNAQGSRRAMTPSEFDSSRNPNQSSFRWDQNSGPISKGKNSIMKRLTNAQTFVKQYQHSHQYTHGIQQSSIAVSLPKRTNVPVQIASNQQIHSPNNFQQQQQQQQQQSQQLQQGKSATLRESLPVRFNYLR